MNRHSQRGIALVITLIMLAVVTVMVVIFLGVSTRERGSVTVSADFTDAKLAADAALNRAQAEVISRIVASSNLFAYDLMVSTNFITPGGFQPGVSSLTNVSYTDASGAPLRDIDQIRQNLTNLFYDPRPPVYIGNDFRYYLDLNRNRRFDTNGWLTAREGNNFVTNFFVGDPEWIGILERPDQPHSASNRFVARFAFMVAPAGKTLDLNYIHNRAVAFRPVRPPTLTDFSRNLGAGSWEINLASFLADLNANRWHTVFNSTYYSFTNSGNLATSSGLAFTDALSILRYRYPADPTNLSWQFRPNNTARLTESPSDVRSDGPLMLGTVPDPGDDAAPERSWSGADSTSGRTFVSITELFDTNKFPALSIPYRLNTAGSATTSAYDQYTFYRLAGQLGTESLPAHRGRLNLNFDNVDSNGQIDPALSARMIPWTATRFFTNAARLILQSQFPDSYSGSATGLEIPVASVIGSGSLAYVTNHYSAGVHRALQLAANLWDSTTNRTDLSAAPYFPTVFRPVFRNQSGTNLSIVNFVEETGTNFLNRRWRDLNLQTDRQQLQPDDNVFGVPLVIGAKKGFPNFNKFYQQTIAQVTRRLQGEKSNKDAVPPNIRFYQSYEFGVSNYFGIEGWNSYASNYPRGLHLIVTNRCIYTLRDSAPDPLRVVNLTVGTSTNIPPGAWSGGGFQVPIAQSFTFLSNSTYNAATRRFNPVANPIQFDRLGGLGNPAGQWNLIMTNRVQFILVDTASQRIVDFVNLDNVISGIDIGNKLSDRSGQVGGQQTDRDAPFWQTNTVVSSLVPGNPTAGVTNQINASITEDAWNAGLWRDYSSAIGGDNVQSAIDGFRVFMGMSPLFNTPANPSSASALTMQVPFTPTATLELRMSWQVNDPLVHQHIQDLYDPFYTDTNRINRLTFSDLSFPEPSGLGSRNDRYRPWGRKPGDTVANEDLARQDPLISRSDDWNFPTNQYPGLGWLGRVHRGTPWQTVYLKSAVEPLRQWAVWSGSTNSHPTRDWWLPSLFTTAPNDNAAHGLLSINQTNLAAWSAVLGGVSVLSNNVANPAQGITPGYAPMFIEPGSPQLLTIVSNINATRLTQTNLPAYQKFRTLGEVLASPALSVASPYLNTSSKGPANYGINDEVYERIPQQVLSLLKDDEPFVVILAYGQSLKPADRSLITAAGPYQGVCTNYQITGEYVTKTAMRYQELRHPNGRPSGLFKGFVESYTVLPSE